MPKSSLISRLKTTFDLDDVRALVLTMAPCSVSVTRRIIDLLGFVLSADLDRPFLCHKTFYEV